MPLGERVRTPWKADTPIEHALRALLVGLDLEPARTGSARFVLSKRASNYDVHVMVSESQPDGSGDRKKAHSVIARRLGSCDAVARAAATPRGVVVRLDDRQLVESVCGAIVGDPLRYGESGASSGTKVNVTYSTPNANKALHVGHLRANFVGMALVGMLRSQGCMVTATDLVSDYGIHLCQAVIGYQRWGEGHTPGTAVMGGDAFVGKWYARFHNEAARENENELSAAAAGLLRRLDAGDPEAHALNDQVTRWSIEGIRQTYQRIGTHHDAVFYESDTLPLARETLSRGLEKGVCSLRPDGSLKFDLTDIGFGEVTALRADGTPLVFAQLMGVWVKRAQLDATVDQLHLVGGQWQPGIAALIEIVRRLGHEGAADRTEQVNFGMISTPEGQIRSRTGNAMGAEPLLDRLRDSVAARWSKAASTPVNTRQRDMCELLGTATAKLMLLQVPRAQDIVFDEAAMTAGACNRLLSLLTTIVVAERNGAGADNERRAGATAALPEPARELLLLLNSFPRLLREATDRRDPAVVLRYAYRLTDAAEESSSDMPPLLSVAVAVVLRRTLAVLNIDVPPYLGEIVALLGSTATP